MATAYTSLLGLALPVTGELSGTWGDTVNNSITSLLDSAIAGTTTLSSDADVTLTTTTGASNTSRQAILLWTAGGTVTRNITAPAQSKIYTVINKSSSTQSIVLRGVGPTTGVTIVKDESAVCAWNGSDFIKISNTSGAGVFTTLSVTGVATFSAGTAALPAITTTGDTNTGIWFPAADTIAFTEGGVESMRIDASGNLGIGTSSPAVKLDVNGVGGALSAVNPPLQVWDTTALAANIGGGIAFGGNYTGSTKTNWAGIAGLKENATDNNYSGYLAFYTRTHGSGNAERARIDSSGNLGIGTSSPGVKLETSTARSATVTSAIFGQTGTGVVNDVNKITLKVQNTLSGSTGGSGIGAILEASASNKTGLGFYYDSGSGSQTEAARIDSSGNLLVGTTDNSNLASAQGLYLRGTGADNCLYGLNNATTTSGVSLALFYSSFSTANQTKFEVKSDGDVFSRTNSYGGFSDVRLKQGITPASSQWSDIKNIEVVKFQMKSEQFSDAENPWMLGVIAQQVEQVSPRLVDEDVKDGMKTVKYSILYMKAVKALQEAMARIEQLETRITALEGA